MKPTKFFLFLFLMLLSSFKEMNHHPLHGATIDANPTISFSHASGKTSSILISQDGIVYGFGLWGEINNPACQLKMVEPKSIASSLLLEEGDRFVSVSSGEQHSFLLSANGRLFGFGSNEHNQLLLNDVSFSSKVVELTDYFNLDINDSIESIACGSNFNVVLTKKHQVITFGENQLGQLGIDLTESPYRTHNITASFPLSEYDYIKSISCGASYALALTNNGLVYGWGSNEFYQLGSTEFAYTSIPVLIDQLPNNVAQISTGRYTSYALTTDHLLYGWGANNEGQLGSKDVIVTSGNNRSTPYLMNQNFPLESDELIYAIYGGYYYGIVMTNYHNLYGFGQNSSGQLGNGSQISTSYPLKIEYQNLLAVQDEIVAISCGQEHVIATTKQGHIFAWGSNLQGQLSASYESIKQFSSVVEVTNNFPPIIHILALSSSNIGQSYQLQIEAYYLSDKPIESIYYCFSSYDDIIPKNNWQQYTLQSVITKNDVDGIYYLWVKVISDNQKEYVECSSFFVIDKTAPVILLQDQKNEEVVHYATSPVHVQISDQHATKLFYSYGAKNYESEETDLVLTQDGNYTLYAQDEAGNKSIVYQFVLDQTAPKIQKINQYLLEDNLTFQTREKTITIEASEEIACYKLGYKGSVNDEWIALNENATSFEIKLKKGVNTLIIYDVAGNESGSLEILYSPTFFNDPQLLLLVFGTLTVLFVAIIILTYVLKSRKKLAAIEEMKQEDKQENQDL